MFGFYLYEPAAGLFFVGPFGEAFVYNLQAEPEAECSTGHLEGAARHKTTAKAAVRLPCAIISHVQHPRNMYIPEYLEDLRISNATHHESYVGSALR